VKKRCRFWLVLIGVLLYSSFANANILINEILANGVNDPDSEWVNWSKNIFWHYFQSGIPARKRMAPSAMIIGTIGCTVLLLCFYLKIQL